MSTTWNPKVWVAVLLGVCLQYATFLYINRPKLFFVYFALVVVVAVIDWQFQTSLTWWFSLVCPLHAYSIIKRDPPQAGRAWYSKWWGLSLIVVPLILAVFLVRSFLYEPFRVPSNSMQPTIAAGDKIIVKKLGFGSYGTLGIELSPGASVRPALMQRGKLYVFYPPHQRLLNVKRLVGLPGDTIELANNKLIINGVTQTTELVGQGDMTSVYRQSIDNIEFKIQRVDAAIPGKMRGWVLPERSYFFLGDNRDNSSDSRVWGYVAEDKILGEVIAVFQ